MHFSSVIALCKTFLFRILCLFYGWLNDSLDTQNKLYDVFIHSIFTTTIVTDHFSSPSVARGDSYSILVAFEQTLHNWTSRWLFYETVFQNRHVICRGSFTAFQFSIITDRRTDGQREIGSDIFLVITLWPWCAHNAMEMQDMTDSVANAPTPFMHKAQACLS